MSAENWSAPVADAEMRRRCGGRRRYNAWRAFCAGERRRSLVELFGPLIFLRPRRGQMRAAAEALGVERTTIWRDCIVLRAQWAEYMQTPAGWGRVMGPRDGTARAFGPAEDKLRHADTVVEALSNALTRADHRLALVPGLVLQLINGDLWQERIVQRTGEYVRFARFEEFVTTPPLDGLGASLATLRRVCAGRVEVLNALDRVTVGELRPPTSE